MNRILLALLLMGMSGLTMAQKKYTISPSHTLSGIAEFELYTNFKIYQDNISNDTVVIKWKLISDDLIKSWDYSSCAFGICYVSIPDTLCTMVIPPGESGFLSLTIDPKNIQGTGKASIYLYDSTDPSNTDTITFIINAASANGINDYAFANALKIYPNPSSGILHIKNERTDVSNAAIQIKDMLGREVYAGQASVNGLNVIDVSSFLEGIYFVRYDYGDGTFSTQKLQIIN